MSAAELAAMAAIVPGSPQAWQGFEGDATAKEALSPLLGVTISFLAISTAFVVLRFITSIFLRGKTYKLGLEYVCCVTIHKLLVHVLSSLTSVTGSLSQRGFRLWLCAQ